jgi:hypothetical protein
MPIWLSLSSVPVRMPTTQRIPASYAAQASEAEVLPVEAQATARAPMLSATEMPTVILRSLKLPVPQIPFFLTITRQ